MNTIISVEIERPFWLRLISLFILSKYKKLKKEKDYTVSEEGHIKILCKVKKDTNIIARYEYDSSWDTGFVKYNENK